MTEYLSPCYGRGSVHPPRHADHFTLQLPELVDLSGFVRVRKGEWTPDSECSVHQHEVLHAVMDRLCEVCHEMFYHEEGNLRSQCRMRCFDNDVFRKCLHVFSSIEGKDLKSENAIS